MRGDISLIKGFSFGAGFFFFFSLQTPALPAKQPWPAWPPGYLHMPASGTFRAARPPCSGAVIDILIRRQEAADQVLPRRGLEAARSANWPERRRHVPQQQ